MKAEHAFSQAWRVFREASRTHASCLHERAYRFAGRRVRLQVVGDLLADLMHLPFAHLQEDHVPSGTADLTISLWDQASLSHPAALDAGEGEWPSFRKSADGRFALSRLSHSLSCLDREEAQIVGFVNDARCLSLYERGRPLHVPLSIWHADRGVPLIHAGLVSQRGMGLLFAGSAGVGKTTTALSCLCAGFDYLGDDLVGLETASEIILGHSLYGSSLVDPRSLRWFSPICGHSTQGSHADEEKQLAFLTEIFAARMQRVCEIRAVVLLRLPRDSCQRPEVHPASKAEALLALAPSSLLIGVLSPGVSGFEALARLVESVPLYWLDPGSDVERIPAEVGRLIDLVGGRPGG
jgi:hypothetical protein